MDGILIVATGFAILLVAGIAIMSYLDRRAPFGWQDENGFHYGRERRLDDQTPNPKTKRS